MNPLEMLFAFREKAKAYGDAERNRLLQQFGLDPLSMQRQQMEQQGQILWDQKQRQEQADQQAYAKGASAWAKMNPNIGAGGSYVLSQMGGSADTRARGDALMAAYGQQHAGPTMLQRMQMQQAQDQFQQSYNLDVQRTNAAVAASQATQYAAQQKAFAEAAFGNMPPEQFFKQADETRGLSESVGATRKLISLVTDYSKLGRLASPEIRGRMQGMIMSVIPAVQSALNRGGQNALGTEERTYIEGLLGDPNSLLGLDSTSLAKLKEIEARLTRDYEFRKTTRGKYLPASTFDIPSYDLNGLIPLGDAPPQLRPQSGPAGAGYGPYGAVPY